MSFVKYKLGNQSQIIQFDESPVNVEEIFFNIVQQTGNLYEYYLNEEPLITVSNKLPKNLEQWDQKHVFQKCKQIVFYTKRKNNKIYIYWYNKRNLYYLRDNSVRVKDFNIIIIKMLFFNMFLQNNNLIYLHGMLLNNGDVIVSNCCGGKTTLARRIKNYYQDLKVICDDGILIDVQNKIVYPLPYFWNDYKQTNPFYMKIVNINNPIKLNNLFLLKKDNQQKIIQIDKQQWLKQMDNILNVYYNFPFQIRQKSNEGQKWIDIRKELCQQVKQLNKKQLDKLTIFPPLCITTNTGDGVKKFKVIEDMLCL